MGYLQDHAGKDTTQINEYTVHSMTLRAPGRRETHPVMECRCEKPDATQQAVIWWHRVSEQVLPRQGPIGCTESAVEVQRRLLRRRHHVPGSDGARLSGA